MLDVLKFILYVTAFWALWKVLDASLHGWKSYFKKEEPVKHDPCPLCKNEPVVIEKIIEKLVEKIVERKVSTSWDNQSLDRQLKDIEKFRKDEQEAVKKINEATQDQLEAIHGIGPVSDKKVAEKRPFRDFQHIKEALRESIANKIILWAKRKQTNYNERYRLGNRRAY